MRIIIGVATVPARYPFFSKKVLPNLKAMSDEVWVYTDGNSPVLIRHTSFGTSLVDCPHQSVGDAGKFFGAERTTHQDFYYLSCDDDLIYPWDYAEKMIQWIDFFDRRAVISLHGSTFSQMPVTSYYKDKGTIPCLGVSLVAQRVLFPGSGASGFHSSCLNIDVKSQFLCRNMADVWFGRLLQIQKIPA
ncbi:hypothetical protein LCGC14_2429670, partial [marine sediment metagenome]